MVPLDSPPVRAALPVYLAALGPRMLELAGRIADGVILNLMTPAQAGEAARTVRAAALAAGRDPASVEVACVVHCCVADDGADGSAAAAAAARGIVPSYVLHPAAPRLFGELDGGPSLRAARERVLAGDRAGAAALVPQQVADGFVAHGGADEVLARVAQYQAAGVDLPVLFPVPAGGDWGYEKTIAALAGKVLPMSEELVVRFFAALEAGDIAALREIYAPDAVIWHNDDLIEQPVEENLKVLAGLHRVVSGLRYDVIRRVPRRTACCSSMSARPPARRRRGRAARRDVPAGRATGTSPGSRSTSIPVSGRRSRPPARPRRARGKTRPRSAAQPPVTHSARPGNDPNGSKSFGQSKDFDENDRNVWAKINGLAGSKLFRIPCIRPITVLHSF